MLCGDFNAVRESPAVRALTTHAPLGLAHAARGAAAPAFTTWKYRPAKGADGNGNGNGNGVSARSAPPSPSPPPLLPLCEKAETIDHLLHTPSLRAIAAWGAPSRDAIGPAALPSAVYPSDHLAQVVDFEWCD